MVNVIILISGMSTRLINYIKQKKQFYQINGKELFIYTLECFLNDKRFDNIYLTISKDDEKLVKDILNKYDYQNRVKLVYGGKNREESVYNSLLQIEKDNYLSSFSFIHDGARPLVRKQFLDDLFSNLDEKFSLIPYLKIPNALFNKKENRYENRDDFIEIQTPQVFLSSNLLPLMKKNCSILNSFYDEGSILINERKDIKLLKGDIFNIKVSDIDSLELVKQILYGSEKNI